MITIGYLYPDDPLQTQIQTTIPRTETEPKENKKSEPIVPTACLK